MSRPKAYLTSLAGSATITFGAFLIGLTGSAGNLHHASHVALVAGGALLVLSGVVLWVEQLITG